MGIILGTRLGLVFIFVVSAIGSYPGQATATTNNKVRVGALYNINVKGRHDKGIQEALSDHNLKGRVQMETFPYLDESQGLELLVDVIENERVDIVLGPTDSGIFTRALEQREELARHKIPVISSLVTATGPNRPDGWFFRTNVDVHRRVETIYDFLRHHWISSIAVVYAGTEFGRQAEKEFKSALSGRRKTNYQAYRYRPTNVLRDSRSAITELLAVRPEAVGVFGSDVEIVEFYKQLQSMSQGYPYRPMLFTIIDIRGVAKEVDTFYFVSLEVTSGTLDEVEALSYDTTRFVLDEIAELPGKRYDPDKFRERFSALLNGSIKKTDSKTRMEFAAFENKTLPMVFQLEGGRPIMVGAQKAEPLYDDFMVWLEALGSKWELKWNLIGSRFGVWPKINILLILLVVGVFSLLDLKRWYGGDIRKLLGARSVAYVSLLAFSNAVLALLLYVYLAESGAIRYDSLLTALIIAFTPSAVLRTTLFETPTGKAIGFAPLYDRFLIWINDKLMMARYRHQNDIVNFIAFSNSLSDLKNELHQIYDNQPNRQQRSRLRDELDEQLRNADSLLRRRQICARRLLHRLGWKELKEKGIIPEGFSEEELLRPEQIIRESVEHCLNHQPPVNVEKNLRRKLEDLETSNADLAQKIRQELEEELSQAGSIRGRLHIQIKFLMLRFGYFGKDLKKMKNEHLLPEGYEFSSGSPPS